MGVVQNLNCATQPDRADCQEKPIGSIKRGLPEKPGETRRRSSDSVAPASATMALAGR